MRTIESRGGTTLPVGETWLFTCLAQVEPIARRDIEPGQQVWNEANQLFYDNEVTVISIAELGADHVV